MDPLAILKTLWNHKLLALTVIIATLGACTYVYFFAPRSYEGSVTYAMTAPNVPTSDEMLRDNKLSALNSDNPYLRSPDSSLLTQVAIAKLTDPAYVKSLQDSGVAADFTIIPVASVGLGLVSITAVSDSEDESVATAEFLGTEFTATLKTVQKVNGADDRYLYEPILVRGPGPAIEMYSSRLRSLIMVGIAGGLALFAAVSVAQSITLRKKRLATDPVLEEMSSADIGPTHGRLDHDRIRTARTDKKSQDTTNDYSSTTNDFEAEHVPSRTYQRR